MPATFSGRRIGKEVKILCGPAAVREERAAEYVTGPKAREDRLRARTPKPEYLPFGMEAHTATSDGRLCVSPALR